MARQTWMPLCAELFEIALLATRVVGNQVAKAALDRV